MLNLLFAPKGLTYGTLARRAETKAKWDEHVARFPQNPNEPWERWRKNAMHARNHLQRPELANLPVRFICEVQLVLRPYKDARSGA